MDHDMDTQIRDCDEEPDILIDEVKAAKRLKDGKSMGIDGISAEVLKSMDEESQRIYQLAREYGKPASGLRCSSVLIPLHKKEPTSSCDNYRLVVLTTHASKKCCIFFK